MRPTQNLQGGGGGMPFGKYNKSVPRPPSDVLRPSPLRLFPSFRWDDQVFLKLPTGALGRPIPCTRTS